MTIKNVCPYNRITVLITSLISLFVYITPLFSEDDIFDENNLFSDSVTIVDSSYVVGIDTVDIQDQRRLGFSGEITASFQPSLTRSWFTDGNRSQDALFSSFAVGHISLDARLPGGFKTFASAETRYNAGSDSISFGIRELFLDVNIKKAVYFRMGKQVLQWGRCYLWNPTDLINIEKKSFVRKIGSREGAYGLKMHIPFGTRYNIYGYLDARNINRIDSISGTAKFEFLIGKTEMAVSAWAKRRVSPVYAFDISTGFLDLLINGEIALYKKITIHGVSFTDSIPRFPSEEKKWLPRACIGVSRYFTVNGVPDRLMTTVEMYYNQPGNDQNELPVPDRILNNDTLAAIILASGLYEPNNISRFYLSVFSSFNKFIISDMALYINAIGNLNHRCAMVTAGITYKNLHNFFYELLFIGYIGKDRTEYTISNNGLQIQFSAGLSF